MLCFGIFRELAKASFSSATLACGERWLEEATLSMREIIETLAYLPTKTNTK